MDQYEFKFDYNPLPIIQDICLSGSIPDKLSYQYYPTPDELGERMAKKLGVLAGDNLLEPSAGQGCLAKHLSGNVTLVEISKLHCDILTKHIITFYYLSLKMN